MMEHKLLEPNELIIELNDAELDAVSGGQTSLVGIVQIKSSGNYIVEDATGNASVFGNTSTTTQINSNSGTVGSDQGFPVIIL